MKGLLKGEGTSKKERREIKMGGVKNLVDAPLTHWSIFHNSLESVVDLNSETPKLGACVDHSSCFDHQRPTPCHHVLIF